MRPRGFYIDETLQVNTAVMNLRGLPAASTFTYQWIYVSANGTSEGPAAGAPSDTQSYALTSVDNGRYLQVEITFTPTEPLGALERMVLANVRTPAIGERPPARYAEDLSAQVPTNGGSVTLTWSLASTQDDLPAKFQYRYKPTNLLDTTPFANTDWGRRVRRCEHEEPDHHQRSDQRGGLHV